MALRQSQVKSGSADLLHDAGAKIDLNPAQVSECIKQVNFGFMFAPMHHQAMKMLPSHAKKLLLIKQYLTR